jgi:hypothetical protein
MDNAQEVNNFINIPPSQTLYIMNESKPYAHHTAW